MEEVKVAYCRVSTEHEEQESSFINQQRYYKSKGIDTIYADKGLTGTDINRPQFLQMLKDAGLTTERVGNKLVTKVTTRKPKFNLIYCKSISRFSRNVAQAIDILRDLSTKEVYVYFEDIAKSTKDPTTSLLLNIMLSVSQAESETLSSRVKWGNKRTAENGRIRSLTLFGYNYLPESQSLVIEPSEANIVRYIFKLRLEGNGARKIANELNKEGYRTKTGKEWKPHYINRILHNKTYAGYVVRNKSTNTDIFSGKRKSNNPKDYIVTKSNSIDPIISLRDYNKVQELIENNINKNGRKAGIYQGKSEYANKIVCNNCNSFYIQNKDKRRVFYNCSNKKKNGVKSCRSRNITKQEIDNKLEYLLINGNLKKVANNFLHITEDLINKAKQEVNTKRNNNNLEEINRLTEENNSIALKQSKLLDIYLCGELDKEIYLEKKNALERQITANNKVLEKLTRGDKEIEEIKGKLDSLLESAEREINKVPTNITKEELLEKYIWNIVVSDNNVKVYHKFHLIIYTVKQLTKYTLDK